MKLRKFALFGAYCAIVFNLSVVPVSSKVTSGLQCEKFLADENLKNLINTKQQLASPCPCYEHQMEFEYSFKQDNHCYTEWFFTDGVKQKCCYSQYGKLITTAPDAGFVHFSEAVVQMDDLHQLCCGSSEEFCESFYRLNIPDSCAKWSFSTTAQSGGDTEIESIDNFRYSFNGHGEYIFLRANGSNGDVEVQIRTDYVVPGNKDATEIVAFAIRVKNTKHSETVHIIKNTTSGKVLYLNASTSFSGKPKQTDCFSVFPAGLNAFRLTPIVQIPWLQHFEFPDLPYLTVNIKNKRGNHTITGVHGLAENAIEEMYFFRNGSHCTKNCSEYEMFSFGESWSLEKYENESVFDYDLTKGNFAKYNHQHTSPRFLEALLGNLTALFENCTEGNITVFNRTCRNSWDNSPDNECLLAIARTHDIDVGINLHKTNELDQEEYLRRHDKPPRFSECMPDSVTIIYGLNKSYSLDLNNCTDDESKESLHFDVEPDFEEYTIVDGVFNWTVGVGLRNTSNARVLAFIVTDKYNHTRHHDLKVSYCGCEHYDECKFDSSGDGLQTVHCKCPPHLQGTFCETPIDFCNKTKCYEPEKCNHTSTNRDNPCAPCPKGRRGEVIGGVQHCDDVDECAADYDGHDKCQQNCNNTDGSFICSCNSGYDLDTTNNQTCTDIDECKKGTVTCSQAYQVCSNTIGGHECVCQSGKILNTISNACEDVVGRTFVGALVYDIGDADRLHGTNETLDGLKTNATKLLNGMLNDSFSGYEDITVYAIFISEKNQENSALTKKLQIEFTLIVNSSSTYSYDDLEEKMKPILKHIDSFAGVSILPLIEITIFKPSEGGVCSVPGYAQCDTLTTHCENMEPTKFDDPESYYSCNCSDGYKQTYRSHTFCEDINECEGFDTSTFQERCVHGLQCINQIGDWNCTCPQDTLWMSFGNSSRPMYRCQGNYSYLGSIGIRMFETEYRDNEGMLKLLKHVLSASLVNDTLDTITSDVDTPLRFRFVPSGTSILNHTMLTFGKLDLYREYTYTFIVRLGDPVQTTRLQTVLNTYIKENNSPRKIEYLNVTIFKEEENVLCRLTNNGGCEIKSTNCIQANGTTHCECKHGFHTYGSVQAVCFDTDECSAGSNPCQHGKCSNIDGSYTCSCEDGYNVKVSNGSPTCEDINECDISPCGDRECTNYNGGYNCSCHDGYKPKTDNDGCEDIDECAEPKAVCSNGRCTNTPGNYSCNCDSGFIFNTSSEQCEDIDECSNTNYFCKNATNCTNSIGSWDCSCNSDATAVRINTTLIECLSSNYSICTEVNITCNHGNAICINRTWSCDCDYGYRKKGVGLTSTCENINECDENSDICGNGTCIEAKGNYTCNCNSGYEVTNGTNVTCIDIDECESSEYQCGNNNSGNCTNLPGSYTCECLEGYYSEQTLDNHTTCHDVDECTNKAFSFTNAKCANTNGSFDVTCFEGYGPNATDTGHHFHCEDIDECESIQHVCGGTEMGNCTNINGSYTCQCAQGYQNNVTSNTCIDIDECHADGYICGDNGSGDCQNSNGGYNCYCKSGYHAKTLGEKVTICEDFNECENETYTCNGTCKNSQGGWDCNCKDGYTNNTSDDGLHKFCSDIDECHNNTYTCIDSTDCINTEGGWQCLCEGKRVSERKNDTTFECLPDFQYIATVVVKIYPDTETKISELELYISNGIRQIFMQSDDLNSQIVLPVEITNNSKRELTDRMSTENFETAVTFILHLTKQSTKATLKEIWASIWKSKKAFFSETSNVTSTVIKISGELDEYAAETKGLCSIPSVNYCNETRSVCNDSNGQIQCNCRPGYHKETLKNKTCVPKEDKKEEVALVCTVSFSMDTKTTNYSTIKLQVKEQMKLVYEKMFPNVSVWIEVINISNTSSNRRKRSETEQTVEFIAHFEQTDTQTNTVIKYTEINETLFNKFVKETQSEMNSTLNIGAAITVKPANKTDLCSISHMCDNISTECTSNTSKITCSCKEGYVNNTKNNEMFQCSWADPTRSKPTSPTTTITTTEQPDVATKHIEPDQKSQTALIATGAGLGGLVLILFVVVVVVCRRQRTNKEKEAELIQLKEREKKRQTGFDGSVLERNYIGRHSGSEHRNGGPYPSGPFKPISNGRASSFQPIDTETAFNNGGYAASDRRLSEPLYSKTNKPSVDVYPSSDNSHRKPFTQDMVRVFPETNGVRSPRLRSTSTGVDTGRVFQVPEPKPDYDVPATPPPDYHRRSRSRDRLNMSRDSGLNGFNSSGSMERTRSRDSHGYGSLERGRAPRRNSQF